MDLNEKLVELRKAKGLTQKELAEALNVTRQAVSRWEVGTAVPSLDSLALLSRLYGVPLDELIQKEVGQSAEEPSSVPANACRSSAGWSCIALVLSLFLAVLILGVGILIGMDLPREKSFRFDPGLRVDVSGPRGWLEQTPADVEDELQWLETTVKDILARSPS